MANEKPLVEGIDYYVDREGLWVFTADFLRRRGFCCHQGCRHCPYGEEPKTTRVRASVLCTHEGKLLLVRMREPKSGVVRPYPPGGAIETGETPAQAAIRETLEETGYRIRLISGSETRCRYLYQWGGREVDVTTHFFRATLADPAAAPADFARREIVAVEWVAIKEAAAVFAKDPALAPVLLPLLAACH